MSITKRNFLLKKLGFIGGGNITQAFIKGLSSATNFEPKSIIVSEPNPKIRKFLSETYDISVIFDNQAILNNSYYTILAIKPNTFRTIKHDLVPMNREINSNIISVMAGIKYKELTNTFNTNNIFRCMPNTSAQINKSVTLWFTHSKNKDAINNVSQLFSHLGFEQKVDIENNIDKATAITGSGPAYIYMMMESMIDAGVLIGLNREIATEMVINTFEGSSLMAKNTNKPINILKQQITSPGGTTAQALYQLEKSGFKHSINEAVLAAYAHSNK